MATKPSNKQMFEAKQGIKEYIASVGVSPEVLVKVGQMADAVIKDRTLYPVFKEQAVASKLVEPDELDMKVDYPSLAVFSTMGKITEQMLASREIGA
jgi:hypothetical protein